VRSSPFLCLDLAKRNLVQSVTCREIIDEFQEKLQVKFNYQLEQAKAACDDLKSYSQLVSISNTLKVVSQDPDDDMVLECALVGCAQYIVTGDRHLLSLGHYQSILIVKARDFLAIASG
jgi:putative PIN family toxin of toxin-antitoxin system